MTIINIFDKQRMTNQLFVLLKFVSHTIQTIPWVNKTSLIYLQWIHVWQNYNCIHTFHLLLTCIIHNNLITQSYIFIYFSLNSFNLSTITYIYLSLFLCPLPWVYFPCQNVFISLHINLSHVKPFKVHIS